MTVEDVCALIRSLKYKPHHTFGCTVETCGVRAYLNYPLTHHNPPGVTIRNVTFLAFDILVTAKAIQAATVDTMTAVLYRWIVRCEEHEMKEWFRVDGVKVYDPHVPGSIHGYGYDNIFMETP